MRYFALPLGWRPHLIDKVKEWNPELYQRSLDFDKPGAKDKSIDNVPVHIPYSEIVGAVPCKEGYSGKGDFDSLVFEVRISDKVR